MKKNILVVLIFLTIKANAQEELTMRFLPQLQESGWAMPCNRTDAKISFGLPILSSTSVHLFSNGFTYHDLFKNVGDTTYLQLGNVINQLKTNNFVGFGMTTSLFNFNYTGRKISVGFFINLKTVSQFTYPGDLFKLLWNGNGPYLGQTMQIGNFGLNAMVYTEYGLHFSTTYKKKWTFGINPKLLFGKFDINTQNTSVTLYTDPSYYQMTATANLNIQTSGIPDSAQQNDNKYLKSLIFNTANKGFALDFAAKYQYRYNISFAAGINDLGFINWKSNITNYTSNISNVNFDGFHAENFFQNDTSTDYSTKNYTDSLKKKMQLVKNYNNYSTAIPINFFAMAPYGIGIHHKFSAQFNWYSFANSQSKALSLCYQLKLGKHLSVAATYTGKSRSPFNLGGGLIFQFLNMQWYFVTDNWWAAVRPLDSKNVNLRFGMNIVWGDANKKYDDAPKPMMEELKEKK